MTYRMPRFTFRYILLAVILACACWARGSGVWRLLRILRNPDAAPEAPFVLTTATRNIGTGSLRRDQILAINGRPFIGAKQFDDAVFNSHPGDKITVTLSEPSGNSIEKMVTIPSQRINFVSSERIPLALTLDVLVPLVCIFLGAFAVAVRPADLNAWLLLFLMVAFGELAPRDYGNVDVFTLAWSNGMGMLWPVFMMLFGIYFPEPSPFEKKRPWLKYLLILPAAAIPAIIMATYLIWLYDINAAARFRSIFIPLYFLETFVGMLAISTYFANLGMKSRMATSADSRRRLRILMWGSCISLTPLLILLVRSLVIGTDILDVDWILQAITLAFLSLFPFTLAYVIVVERAMDLSFVLRRSLQYGLARGGFWVARLVLIVLTVNLIRLLTLHGSDEWKPLQFAAVGIGFLAIRKRTANKATQWIDRKFFRESYDAERVLAGLAKEAGSFVEIQPLLENVASSVSRTLHVPDIVILLREGDVFVPRYSTRDGEPMNIVASGRIVKNLRERNEALEIYFDKPPLWIRSLSAEELQTLDHMRTQLMLPLTTRSELTGIFSLGPKLSEVPYSDTDIRLLQAIAWQMSIALENSRLVASLAAEAADRERANRELEIAREVQERLFPQNFPRRLRASIAQATAVRRAVWVAITTISFSWKTAGWESRSVMFPVRESRQRCLWPACRPHCAGRRWLECIISRH